MKANELEVGELYRFIQLENGEFEFDHVDATMGNSHRFMANGRKVISAGYVSIKRDSIKVPEPWSSTLGIGCNEQTYKDLEKTLGKRVKDKFE
jgi:hypothetical protein